MTSSSASWRRTHTCGELRKDNVGQTVTLNGWVNKRRDHGGIYFIDLRDRYGMTQIVLDEAIGDKLKPGPETVLSVTGEVVVRDAANVNAARATGEIELRVTAGEVLAASKVPPFEILDDLDTAIETRLRYRFVDLRRTPLQKNLVHRSRFINAMRRAFERQDFVEVETPILTRATPEGARDYLVPSRVHPGEFYALPQSPQIFKQILMVSGMDRYFQVARCFRDEDLRADRQPEFTQLDMEMSFVEEEDVFATWEKVLVETFKEAMELDVPTPFPRMRYDEAMERYGCDKPDVRFGMELKAVDDWAKTCDFKVFSGNIENGGRVIGLCVPEAKDWSRKQIEGLEPIAKDLGAKGLAWWKAGAEGGTGPLARFAADGKAEALMAALGASEGDLCLFCSDTQATCYKVLAELRNQLGKQLGLTKPDDWRFLWVTHFPMFEEAEVPGTYTSSHHPFTAPEDWDLSGEPGDMCSRAYDLVLNGWELGSGSVRIHRSDVQQKVFDLLGISPEEQKLKFGFLLDALAYGAPPHAGFAVGLDRLTALTAGLDNIRDIIAFPKTATASDLMCEAPSIVDEKQLDEVHIRSVVPAKKG